MKKKCPVCKTEISGNFDFEKIIKSESAKLIRAKNSKKQKQASRENGKLGGRPKKKGEKNVEKN